MEYMEWEYNSYIILLRFILIVGILDLFHGYVFLAERCYAPSFHLNLNWII